MYLKTLLEEISYIDIIGDLNKKISGIEVDSRKVRKDNIFICQKGETVDSHNFIQEVIDKGAVAIFVEKPPIIDNNNVVFIIVQDTKTILSQIYAYFYNYPSEDIEVIGVTGTNGKTTTTHFLNQLYQMKGESTGLIGTIEHKINDTIIESKNTTPMANELQELLSIMRDKGVRKVFMEVSSHGLSMGRVKGVTFKHAILTNITRDHLDFHKTMEKYIEAKSILFNTLGYGYKEKKYTVLNMDDNHSSTLFEKSGTRILTYGIKNISDVQALNIESTSKGLNFNVKYKGVIYPVNTNIVGYYNVYNLLATIALCIADGWGIEDIITKIALLKPIKGRMETIQTNNGKTVIIDYAHTPDGVKSVLTSIPKEQEQKIITIIGSGGERDIGKRPLMAKYAEKYSNYVILTSDNPRKEDPYQILKHMEEGFRHKHYLKEVDREKAIQKGLDLLEKGDILIILGKGHEEYQIIGDKWHPFSDSKTVLKYLKK